MDNMNETRSKEYDAFGPWILVIDEENTLPPLFAGYERLLDRAIMMFKVPRKIERRKANPHMHLYDAVVGLFDTHLVLLSRHGNSVHERRVEYRDIQAIKNYQCLLLGELYLYTDTNIVKIRYNTVSEKIIARVVREIHKQQNNPIRDLKIAPLPYSVDTIDYLYLNLLRILEKDDSSIELVAYQPNAQLENKTGGFSKISHFFSGAPCLQCTAFVSNSKELIIISRSNVLKARRELDYAYAYTYIPISNIEHAGLAVSNADPTLYQLTLRTGDHKFETLFKQNNSGVRALYSALK
jgi:hypothetical protein